MQRFSTPWVLAAGFSVLILSILPGCSGTSSTVTPVTQIVLAPASLSLNPGQVVQIVATPQNSSGGAVVADVSFSSSNPTVAAVTAGGFVCGGTWDSNFITCIPNSGSAAVGQATITATSNGVTATAPVYTHLSADRIIVNPAPGCVSMGATPTYTASVFNVTAAGCSVTSPCDITSTVGPIAFTSTDLSVMANNPTTGVLTATNPGGTSILATVSGLNSVPTPALVCPVAGIFIRDASGSTSFTLAPGATQALVADVLDTNGVSIAPLLTWGSMPNGSARVTGIGGANSATVTAGASGTAIITATCSTPDCNRNVSPQYGQRVVTIAVTGTSVTTIYAASTKSLMLIPFPNATNVPGTAINLPFFPNSMISNSAGTKLYLGSASGLMIVDVVSAAVTTASAIPGTVLAISADGNFIFIADTAGGLVSLYNLATSTIMLTQTASPAVAAFTPDSKSVSFGSGQQLFYDSTKPTATTANLPYVPTALDVNAQGSLTYITSAASQLIDVRSTCDQSDLQTLVANNPSLVAHLPNSQGAVVADSPNLDVITTSPITATGCPTAATNTVNTYNLGSGAFNARQLFLSSDSTRAWLISDLTSVIAFNMTTLTPTAIPLTGGAQPLSGGVTLDGKGFYVGATDNTVHVIDVSTGADLLQVAVGLKDASANPVAPDLVVVLPD